MGCELSVAKPEVMTLTLTYSERKRERERERERVPGMMGGSV